MYSCFPVLISSENPLASWMCQHRWRGDRIPPAQWCFCPWEGFPACARCSRARAGPCPAAFAPSVACANLQWRMSGREVQLLGKTGPRDIISNVQFLISTDSLIAKAGYGKSSPSSCLKVSSRSVLVSFQSSGYSKLSLLFSQTPDWTQITPRCTYVFS